MRSASGLKLIGRLEAYLPAIAAADDLPSSRRRQRWAVLAATFPSLMIALGQVVRYRANIVAAWPMWRAVTLDLLLVVAGALLVAVVGVGLRSWRPAHA